MRENIISGVLQGSILGPCCSTYFYDLFLENGNCCYAIYADDSIPYFVAKNLRNIKSRQNHGKCHYLLSALDRG